MKALLRLYPPAWRARYEAEMTAVLDQRGRRLRDAFDLVAGALDAHRHPVPASAATCTQGGASMSLHRAGWAAIIGGLLWSIAYLGPWLTARALFWARDASGEGIGLSEGQLWLVGLLVAPALLVAAQLRISRSQAWRWPRSWIPAIAALAAVVMIAKLLLNIVRPDRLILGHSGQAELWVVAMLVLVVASFAFGLVLLTTDAMARSASIVLMAGALLNAVFLAVTRGAYLMNALRYAEGVVAAGVLFGISWIVIGLALIKRHPMRSVSPQDVPGPVPKAV